MTLELMSAGSPQTNFGARAVYESSALTNYSYVNTGPGVHRGTVYGLLFDVYPFFVAAQMARQLDSNFVVGIGSSPDSNEDLGNAAAVPLSFPRGVAVAPMARESAGTVAKGTMPAVAAFMVRAAQEYLSLNITEVARAVGVERATVYGWLRGTIQMPREQDKQDRLRVLFTVADAWRARGEGPLGAWRQAPLADGRTLVETLALLDPTTERASSEIAALIERVSALQNEARVVRARTVTERTRRQSTAEREGAAQATGESSDVQVNEVLSHIDWFVQDD